MELAGAVAALLMLVLAAVALLQRRGARVRGTVRVMRRTREVVPVKRQWWPTVPTPVPLTTSIQDVRKM